MYHTCAINRLSGVGICVPESELSISITPALEHDLSSGEAYPPECKFNSGNSGALEDKITIGSFTLQNSSSVVAGFSL